MTDVDVMTEDFITGTVHGPSDSARRTTANLKILTDALCTGGGALQRDPLKFQKTEGWETKVGTKKEKQREQQREGTGDASQVGSLPPAVVKSKPWQRLSHPSPWR